MVEGYRLSPQQRQLWAFDIANQYTQMVVSIDGFLDISLLRQALDELTRRHEILRTGFQTRLGIKWPVQVIAEQRQWEFISCDLQALNEEAQQEKITYTLARACSPEISMLTQPLLQAHLFQLSSTKHCLGLTLPAALADVCTMHILFQEMICCFTALRTPSALPEVSMQYADIAQWLNDLSASEDTSEAALPDYLERVEQLIARQLPEALNVGTRASERRSLSVCLEPEQATQLMQFAEQNALSLTSVVCSCWYTLLWRLTGQEALAVGVVYNGRDYEDLQEAPGPLSICVPLSLELTDDISWLAFARTLQTVVSDHAERQEDFLWERIARRYQLTNLAPRFSAGFESLPQPESYVVEHTSFTAVQQRTWTGQFALKLNYHTSSAGLTLEIEYDAAVYAEATVERLADRLGTVLESVVQHPEIALGRVLVVGRAERAWLLQHLNEVGQESKPACLQQLFALQVQRRPQQLAVIDEHQKLTYEELDAQSNRLARSLQAAGIGPEVLVALSLERSLPMLVAILAVLKAGGTYVPLDQSWPREQIQVVLRDLRIRYMLITPGIEPDHELADVTILPLSLTSEGDARPVVSDVTPSHLAYVLFTSGSTGKPKAVAIEHRQICHYIQSAQQHLKLLPEQVYATVSPFTADLGYTMLFTSLCVGGILHIISPACAVDPEALAAYFSQNSPDYIKIGPPHLAALLSGTRPEALLPRKKLIMGGETLHWNFVERLRELSPTCEIVNHYGPAETTVGALTFDLTEQHSLAATCPIGSPLPGTQVYLLDSYLQPVPTMVPGEIYIGGAGVGRGYLSAPELTAERFLPHPFSTRPGDRFYRTGDRGRYLPDGRIEFLGRVDHQVKIRGFRVEPDGIEPHLLQHPAVKEALVLAEDEREKRQQLTAYVVPRETATAVYKGRERYVLPNNLAVLQLNRYETDFFYKQIFLYRTEFRNNISLPEHAVVFDVGANIGLFTLFVQLGYKDAEIYAFEPIPAIFEVLQLNAELYAPTARLFPLGLANSARDETFTYYPYSSCQSGYYAEAAEDKQTLKAIMLKDEHEEIAAYIDAIVEERSEARQVVCHLRTLSDMIKDHAISHIDLLKIDVEKSELDILQGIQDEDWPKIAQIVIEAHDIHGRIAIIQDILEAQGYSVHVEQNPFIQDTTLYNVYARRSQVVSTSPNDMPAQFPEPYLTSASLAAFLTERLPEYMLPASYVLLPAFPLLPNGKRDRAALRQMSTARHEGESALTPPRTPVEAQLIKIWQDVLKQTEIGIHSNFFTLGGDSILAILVVGQASKAGLHLIAQQLFEHPTIAELAAVVTSEPVIQAEQGPVVGAVRLTPMQRWFFETVQTDRHHWNQAVLLKVTQRLEPALLEKAFQAVLMHHDILRARFFLEHGEWQQVIGESIQEPLLQVVDLTSSHAEAQRIHIEERCAELQATLNLEQGRLVQAMIFDLAREQRLFIVIHHLLVDGVSWQIILGDLYTAYEQLLQNQALQLSPKTTAFQTWSESLAEYARSSALQDELATWLTRVPERGVSLLKEYSLDLNTVASEQAITFTLTAEETRFLLHQIPDLLSVQVQEVLLAALAQAFASQGRSGYLLVDLEGHGREPIQEGIDLSRTVGWFTTLFPLALDMQRVRTSAEALGFVKEQLRSLPHHGIGYGLLRYLRQDLSSTLAERPQAQVRLNYLGQIAQAGSASAFFELVEEQGGSAYSQASQRGYVLDIQGKIVNDQLQLEWLYSQALHTQEEIAELVSCYARSLQAMLAYCRTPEAGKYTPADFPHSDLNQDELDALLEQIDF